MGLVELPRARRNAAVVAAYAARHGLSWRPHVKTHKSTHLGRLQLEAGAKGLTVATLREAEVMASVCDDLLLAYPPVGPRALDRLLALPPRVRLAVALDSEDVLDPLAAAATGRGRDVGILVEVDLGMSRVGIADPERTVELARRADRTAGVDYRGILFYPGHIRAPQEDQTQALEELSARLTHHRRALAAEGLAPDVVSGGSTPTLWRSHEVDGMTEIRPGTCLLHDRDTWSLGVAGDEDLAYTVLATVVSTAVPGQAVVDAGSKALAKETLRGADVGGFGRLRDRPEVTVARVSEEHGVLDLSATDWRPRVGERVRIVPNHVCVSVNLQDRLVVQDGESVATWPVEARGRI